MKIRTYEELIRFPTFKERLEYLKLSDRVGKETFGFDRYLNQTFYKSPEWKAVRNKIIARDQGFDLGVTDNEIFGKIIVHHMNPITKDDLKFSTDYLMNSDYLISTSHATHNAIHYGIDTNCPYFLIDRKPNDTIPWK